MTVSAAELEGTTFHHEVAGEGPAVVLLHGDLLDMRHAGARGGDHLARAIPGARRAVVHGAGPFVNFEQPELYEWLIVDWLRGFYDGEDGHVARGHA